MQTRGPVETTTVMIEVMAEVQRNPGEGWTAVVYGPSTYAATRATREEALAAAAMVAGTRLRGGG
jgi:hypothetical protein